MECKGSTASAHYPLTARSGALFRINPGRNTFDIVPRTNWHKGAAVAWIDGRLRGEEVLTVCLGDGSSDEDPFAVLPGAVTIKAGTAPATWARYQLCGPSAVHEFPLWLAHSARN